MKTPEYTEDENRANKWIDETDIHQFSLMELLTMYASDYHSDKMKDHLGYLNEVKERMIFRFVSEFGEHDMIKKAIEDHFDSIERKLLTTLTKEG